MQIEERRERKKSAGKGAAAGAAVVPVASPGLVPEPAPVQTAGLIGAAGLVGAVPMALGDLHSEQELSSIERDMRKMYHDRYPRWVASTVYIYRVEPSHRSNKEF